MFSKCEAASELMVSFQATKTDLSSPYHPLVFYWPFQGGSSVAVLIVWSVVLYVAFVLFFVFFSVHWGLTGAFCLLQYSSGIVRHPGDLRVSRHVTSVESSSLLHYKL